MNKRIVSLIMAFVLIYNFTGCQKKEKNFNEQYKQILEVCSQRIQDLVGSAVGNYQKSFNYYAYNESKLPVLSYERNVFIILFEKASFLRLSELLGVAYTQIRNPDSNLSLLGRS